MKGNKEETAEGGSLTRTLKEAMIRPLWCLFQANNEFMVSVPVQIQFCNTAVDNASFILRFTSL